MSFLDWFRKGSKDEEKGQRYRGKSLKPQERMTRLEVRWLETLQKKNPAKFDRIMSERYGLDEGKSEIAKLAETLELLQRTGLVDDPKKMGQGDLMKDAMTAIGLVGRAFVTGQAPDGLQGMLPGTPPPQPPQQPSAQIAAPAPEPEGKRPMSILDHAKAKLIKEAVSRKLDGKQPAEAAAILIQAQTEYDVVRELVEGFVLVEDSQMEAFLQGIIQEHPEFSLTLQWLAERPEWFWQCIHAVRGQVQATARQRAAANPGPDQAAAGGAGMGL